MHNIALTWQQAAILAAALGMIAIGMRYAPVDRVRRLTPFATESFLIAALYSVWQLAGEISVTGTSGAFSRSAWIERVEHNLHLPSELSMQSHVIGHPALVQAANLYYATMHFTALFVFLIWLFVRHRDDYGPARTTLALTTLACLLIQLIPVAPPRLLGGGFVDTAARYGQSVYNLGLDADELSAMPSVHVVWAVLIAWYVVRIGRGQWRWLVVVHPVLTVLVVVVTANHYWLDGIVGVVVLVACAWLQYGLRRAARVLRLRQLGRTLPQVRSATQPVGS
ncbi:MAG: phosphatase PAP2 family protein [Jatrophihabitantaceae bacterium]